MEVTHFFVHIDEIQFFIFSFAGSLFHKIWLYTVVCYFQGGLYFRFCDMMLLFFPCVFFFSFPAILFRDRQPIMHSCNSGKAFYLSVNSSLET